MTEKPAWHQSALNVLTESPIKVFSKGSLTALLEDQQNLGRIPKSVSLNALIKVLKKKGALRVVELPHVGYSANADKADYRPFTRYVWGSASPESIALSLRPRSYLSHGSAALINGLIAGAQTRVFANQEQSPKTLPPALILQSALDRAFQNRPRVSNYVFRYEGKDLVLLSGKNTGNFGVGDRKHPNGESYPATNVERTLVDMCVRPAYAGGVALVLSAFRNARSQYSDASIVAGLVTTLGKLEHAYPYHQAIGFYLNRAGVSDEITKPLSELGLKHAFYTDNQISEPAYDSTWRVFYPPELDKL